MGKYSKIAVVVVLCLLAASAGFLAGLLQLSEGPQSVYLQQTGYYPAEEGGGVKVGGVGGGRFPLAVPTPRPFAVAPVEEEIDEKEIDEKRLEYAEKTSAGRSEFEPASERKIIQTASLEIEVKDFQSSFDAVVEIVERSEGFVSDSRVYTTGTGASTGAGERKKAMITVRVPKDNFLAVLSEIERLGTVKSKHTSGEDVTEEFIDLNARLNNSERQERRLLEILETAEEVKDVLEVEQELWRVRSEIESLTGRKKYLENRVELATVSVLLHEPEPITQSWGLRDAFRSAFRGFVSVVRGLVILVGYALPILILLGLGWLVLRLQWRKRG